MCHLLDYINLLSLHIKQKRSIAVFMAFTYKAYFLKIAYCKTMPFVVIDLFCFPLPLTHTYLSKARNPTVLKSSRKFISHKARGSIRQPYFDFHLLCSFVFVFISQLTSSICFVFTFCVFPILWKVYTNEFLLVFLYVQMNRLYCKAATTHTSAKHKNLKISNSMLIV